MIIRSMARFFRMFSVSLTSSCIILCGQEAFWGVGGGTRSLPGPGSSERARKGENRSCGHYRTRGGPQYARAQPTRQRQEDTEKGHRGPEAFAEAEWLQDACAVTSGQAMTGPDLESQRMGLEPSVGQSSPSVQEATLSRFGGVSSVTGASQIHLWKGGDLEVTL